MILRHVNTEPRCSLVFCDLPAEIKRPSMLYSNVENTGPELKPETTADFSHMEGSC